jgi:hypothetical protein
VNGEAEEDEMNEAYELLKWLGGVALLAVLGIIGYFLREERKEMKANITAHTARLDSFDRCVVTRDEFERRMSALNILQGEQHRENRELLERIVEKIDRNEDRASKTRHDTKDEIHVLALKVAQLAKM